MGKKNLRPITKVKNPEPKKKLSVDWIIWAAWADRITFEEIREKTGKKNHRTTIKVATNKYVIINRTCK